MKAFFERNKSNIYKILFFLVSVLLLALVIKYLSRYILPFIVAWILALLLSPIKDLLTKKLKIPKAISAMVAVLLALVLFVLLGNVIYNKIVHEAVLFAQNFSQYTIQIKNTFDTVATKYHDMLELLPDSIRSASGDLLTNMLSTATSFVTGAFRNTSVQFVSSLPNAFVFFLVTFVSTYLFVKDKDEVIRFVSRQLPERAKKYSTIMQKSIVGAVGGYIKAQLIIMCFTGTICIIGLLILQYPYALLVGLAICIVDALPIFGSGFVFWPWVAFSFISGDYRYGIGLFIIYLCVLFTRQLLEPRFIGQGIGLHPIVTLMSMYVGLKIFGVIGFLIGPFVIITLKTLQTSGLLPKWKE